MNYQIIRQIFISFDNVTNPTCKTQNFIKLKNILITDCFIDRETKTILSNDILLIFSQFVVFYSILFTANRSDSLNLFYNVEEVL